MGECFVNEMCKICKGGGGYTELFYAIIPSPSFCCSAIPISRYSFNVFATCLGSPCLKTRLSEDQKYSNIHAVCIRDI